MTEHSPFRRRVGVAHPLPTAPPGSTGIGTMDKAWTARGRGRQSSALARRVSVRGWHADEKGDVLLSGWRPFRPEEVAGRQDRRWTVRLGGNVAAIRLYFAPFTHGGEFSVNAKSNILRSMRGAGPSRSPAEGSSMRGAGPSRSPAEGLSMRGADPSRSPAEGSSASASPALFARLLLLLLPA